MKIETIEVSVYYAFSISAAIMLYKNIAEGDWIIAGIGVLCLFLFTRAMFKTHAALAQKEFVDAVKKKIENDTECLIAGFRTAREKSDEL